MGEALLLCLVGSLYPVALLAVLTYLGSAALASAGKL